LGVKPPTINQHTGADNQNNRIHPNLLHN